MEQQTFIPSTGKTPDGKTFKVPQTHDLLKTLFLPSAPKSFFEYAVLGMILFELSLFFIWRLPKEYFLVIFLFWRLSYNVGLGCLLKLQSDSRFIVNWIDRLGFGPLKASSDEPPSNKNERSNTKNATVSKLDGPKTKNTSLKQHGRNAWVQFIIRQVTIKLGPELHYETTPIEFNAWIIFRGLVDMILINDFFSYFLFACAYFVHPPNGVSWLDLLRYCGGAFLIAFNVWVKMDAHRVVKDFAWYWGDFFFLIETSLTFDGVFEMAPHPMYSVGYIGFYGAALISKSYTVLFVSMLAHAAQFAFLYIVENPHIEKTYNIVGPGGDKDESREILRLYFRRDLIVFKNFDWFRSSDLFSVIIALYAVLVSIAVGPADTASKLYFYVGHALFWRCVHTYGLGAILYLQSRTKFWTKRFVKHGESARDAFQHWKVLYNLTLSMTYTSFIICAIRLYSAPDDWTYGNIWLRHLLGILLILLHVWMSWSVYEVLGDFGWFYGDFFISELRHCRGLYYTGIYRFLNNPEKIMGQASFWGLTLICNSAILFSMTLFAQISTWLFLTYVEAPHMRKIYGSQIRPQAGAENVLKKSVGKVLDSILHSPPKKYEQMSSEESHRVVSSGMLKSTVKKWEDEEIKNAWHKKDDDLFPAENVSQPFDDNQSIDCDLPVSPSNQEDTNTLSKQTRADSLGKRMESMVNHVEKVVQSKIPDIHTIVEKVVLAVDPDDERVKHLPLERYEIKVNLENYSLGDTIQVRYKVPIKFAKPHDWIGLYPLQANPSKTATTVRSNGSWLFITGSQRKTTVSKIDSTNCFSLIDPATKVQVMKNSKGEYVLQGTLNFVGDRLLWLLGGFEARYHYDGKYHVLATSTPFKISQAKFSLQKTMSHQSIELIEFLTDKIKKCLYVDREIPLIIPPEDDIFDCFLSTFGLQDKPSFDKRKRVVSKRILAVIKYEFDIDFDIHVIYQSNCVRDLAEVILSSKNALSE